MIEEIPQEKFREPLKEFAEKAVSITDEIIEITVYGSVARGEADSRSDVDVFVLLLKSLEAETEDRLFELARNISEKHFYRKGEWNKITLVLFSPDRERDFDTRALAAMLGGVRIYSKFKPLVIMPLVPSTLFRLDLGGVSETIKKRMDATLKGWTSSYMGKKGRTEKRYEGLLERYSASRLARDVYVVPSEHVDAFSEFFEGLEIKYTKTRIWLESPMAKDVRKQRGS